MQGRAEFRLRVGDYRIIYAVAVVRGGSYYFPQGSGGYFPNSSRLTEHGKLLLMVPCKDRAATLGFRCVMDAN